MPRFTFRFGEFTGDEGLPPLENLAEEVERKGIYGYQGEKSGAYKHEVGDDFLYIDFVKEVPVSVMQLNEDGDFKQEEVANAKRMQFLLFENGTYGFESRDKVYDSDVFDYLLEDEKYEFDYDLQRFETLSLKQMRSFYKESHKVKKLKADEIGMHEPNPHITDEEIKEITEDFGEYSQSFLASVGRTDGLLIARQQPNKIFDMPYFGRRAN